MLDCSFLMNKLSKITDLANRLEKLGDKATAAHLRKEANAIRDILKKCPPPQIREEVLPPTPKPDWGPPIVVDPEILEELRKKVKSPRSVEARNLIQEEWKKEEEERRRRKQQNTNQTSWTQDTSTSILTPRALRTPTQTISPPTNLPNLPAPMIPAAIRQEQITVQQPNDTAAKILIANTQAAIANSAQMQLWQQRQQQLAAKYTNK